MAQDKILGEQLDVIDVTGDIAEDAIAIQALATGTANDATAIGTISAGIAADPTAVAALEASISHTNIQDIGSTNSHIDIDSHIADPALHFTTLDGLADVVAPTPNPADVLAWNNSSSKWEPEARVTNPMTADLDVGTYKLFTPASSVNVPTNDILIQSGDISFISGGQQAGDIRLSAGTATNNNTAGDILLSGGNSSSLTSGYVSIFGGTNINVAGTGGQVSIAGGVGTAGAVGGKVSVTGGESTNNIAGEVEIVGGRANATSGLGGGAVSITGGKSDNINGTSYGGDVSITGGSTIAPSGQAGSINFRPGQEYNGSASGSINFYSSDNALVEAEIRLWSETGTDAYVALKAPSTTINRTWELPDDDPTVAAGGFLTTDATGVLSFVSYSYLENVVEDLAPQLGGDLDVNGYTIGTPDITTATAAQNVNIRTGDHSYSGGGYRSGTVYISSGVGTNGNDSGHLIFSTSTAASGGDSGNISIVTSAGAVTGGSIDISTASNTTGGTTGNVNLLVGDTISSALPGGITLSAGSNTGTVPGGAVLIEAGSAGTGATGGSVTIRPGAGSTYGSIDFTNPYFQPGEAAIKLWRHTNVLHTAGNSIELTVPNTLTADRSWTLPQDDPSAVDGYLLTTDTNGVLSFTPPYTPLAVNIAVGTNRTLNLADAGQLILMLDAATNTATIPLNATVPFATGTEIVIVQAGTGQTTIIGAGSPPVTILSTDSAVSLAQQYSTATLIQIATDSWLLTGDIV